MFINNPSFLTERYGQRIGRYRHDQVMILTRVVIKEYYLTRQYNFTAIGLIAVF